MNFGDIFRSVFGFSNAKRPLEPDPHQHLEDVEDEEFDRRRNNPDGFFVFGNVPSGFEGKGHGLFGSGMPDMHRQFENMIQQFEDIFLGLGQGGQFPAIDGVPPAGESGDPSSLRDRMLKEPDRDPSNPPRSLRPSPGFPSIFGRLFGDSPPGVHKLPPDQDTDLDEEVRKGNLDQIFGPPSGAMNGQYTEDHPGYAAQPYTENHPGYETQPYKSYKSVSVSSFRSADGRVEERRTIQDARGNEESTVRRAIGEQSHSKTIRRDHTGSEEVKEDFVNLDQGEKSDFDQKWQGRRLPSGGDPFRGKAYVDGSELDRHTRALFGDLFGKNFPGFGED